MFRTPDLVLGVGNNYFFKMAVNTVRKVKGRVAKELKLVSNTTKDKYVPSEAIINELILAHRENGRKLARSILRRWRSRMQAEEIDSIVDLALCESARRFVPEKGASFMTFFFYHLRGLLVRTVVKATNATNIFNAVSESTGGEGSECVTLGDNNQWFHAGDELLVGRQEVVTPEQLLIEHERTELCNRAFSRLSQISKEVISRSFNDEDSLIDIAKELGYSRCHISRIKKSAFSTLKKLYIEEEKRKNVRSTQRDVVNSVKVVKSDKSLKRTTLKTTTRIVGTKRVGER